MDGGTFDRLTRALGATVSRRAGLLGAFGALAGIDAAAKPASRPGAGRGNGRGNAPTRGPKPQGPCGDGSMKANRCTRNSQCCTGICNLTRGKNNNDGKGRCRCQRKGRPCTENRNCCNGTACLDGICGGGGGGPKAMIESGSACIPATDTCRDTDATCTTYASGDPAGTFCLKPSEALCTADPQCVNQSCRQGVCGGKLIPTGESCDPARDSCRNPNATCTTYRHDPNAGTRCLLPRAETCAAGTDCADSVCLDGVCIACSIPACAAACTPIVCATCTHTTVQDAIDAATNGAVIAIGAGTWIEDLTISGKDLTLRACPGDRVVLRNKTAGGDGVGKRTIHVTDTSSLTLLNVIVDGENQRKAKIYGGGIRTQGNLTLAGATVVRNGAWRYSGGGVSSSGKEHTITVTDEAMVRDCESDSYGGGIQLCAIEGPADLVIDGWAAVEGNHSDSYGGGVLVWCDGTNLTIGGHARIVGNTARAGAGVVSLHWAAAHHSTTTIKDDALIANNVARNGSYGMGGGVTVIGYKQGSSDGRMTATITDRVKILNNASLMDDGGGVWVGQWAETTISGNVEISGNTAQTGAGVATIWFDSDRPAGQASVIITGSVKITDNTATELGGGIGVMATQITIAGSAAISGNTAPEGGGIGLDEYQGNPAIADVTESATITGNTAANSGGGVWSNNAINQLTAVSGSITGNSPDQCAGGSISC